MALRESFDAVSVLEHPSGKTFQDQQWPVQFPIENDRTQGYSWKTWHLLAAVLFLAWLGSLTQGLAGGTAEVAEPVLQELLNERKRQLCTIAVWITASLLFVLALNISDLYVRGLWAIVPAFPRAVAIWLIFVAVLALQVFNPLLATVAGVVYLFVHTKQFRRHYVTVCSGGILDATNRELFRRTGKVEVEYHPGRLSAALWDAIRSWNEYNRSEVRLPGLLQSPVGSMGSRVLSTCLASFLVGHVLLFILAELTNVSAGLREATLIFAPYQAATMLLVACALVAPLSLIAYLTALLAESFPILQTAKALKDSSFGPERWDAFLNDLEFDENVTD